jgi:hypothetical protein
MEELIFTNQSFECCESMHGGTVLQDAFTCLFSAIIGGRLHQLIKKQMAPTRGSLGRQLDACYWYNGADSLSSINSLIDDSLKDLVMEDTLDVFADDAASLLTSAMQQSIVHKKKFNEAFAWIKEEHQAKM